MYLILSIGEVKSEISNNIFIFCDRIFWTLSSKQKDFLLSFQISLIQIQGN